MWTVDENLYYRGIHKEEVDHVRRDQTHGLSPETLASPALPAAILQGPEETAATVAEGEKSDASSTKESAVPSLPLPYLFRNAAGLVRLTQQHNVSSLDWLLPSSRYLQQNETDASCGSELVSTAYHRSAVS